MAVWERVFRMSVLISTRCMPISPKACASSRRLKARFAPVRMKAGAIHVPPTSTRRCAGRSSM